VEVFTKNYCRHWQKRKIGNNISQFGSCTFTPRTGKTSAKVVEIVPCARKKWGNWWDISFYVGPGDVKGLPSLPHAILCSHCYVDFPHFEVAEEDEDEGALRYATRLSSKRDLVDKYIICGVWPLAHGWALGEITPAGCRHWGASWCEVLPSPWIYVADMWPYLCVRSRPRPTRLSANTR
jgi:hypothetical protein